MKRHKGENDAEFQSKQHSMKLESSFGKLQNFLKNGTPMNEEEQDSFEDTRLRRSNSNESGSLMSIDFSQVAAAAGLEMPIAESNETPYTTKIASSQSSLAVDKKIQISSRQKIALQKYPALIEILGSDSGDKIASVILSKLNELVVAQISENSKQINKLAYACKADKHNIKQYFVGENESWVCVITASGPFSGTEAFYYDEERDEARILRKIDNDYDDVTQYFNIVHELQTKEDENEN